MPDKQINDQGQVAVRQFRQSERLVEVHGNGYYFAVRASISMAWVNEDDLDAILNYTYNCNCGGTPKIGFGLASEDDVRRWTVGGGR